MSKRQERQDRFTTWLAGTYLVLVVVFVIYVIIDIVRNPLT